MMDLPLIRQQDVNEASVYHEDFWKNLILQGKPARDHADSIRLNMFQTLIGLMIQQYMELGGNGVLVCSITSAFNVQSLGADEVDLLHRAMEVHLDQARVISLVQKLDESGWLLTADGVMFIRQGLRNRHRLSAHTHFAYSPERVCRLCSEGELDDWADAVTDMRAHVECSSDMAMRAQLTNAIVQQTIQKTRGISMTVTPLWAGLIKV